MTKKEKKLIKRAIHLIHYEDEYYEGMDILAKLVGYKEVKPIWDELKTVDVRDLYYETNTKKS